MMGLFYDSKAVRLHCSLLIYRQLRLASDPTLEKCSVDLSDKSLTANKSDIFQNNDNIQLTKWMFSWRPISSAIIKKIHLRDTTLIQSELSTKRGYTHLDVRKVASLGFKDESDPSLRVSACNQLLDMLRGDDQLLRTVDLSWAIHTTNQALSTVEKILTCQFRDDTRIIRGHLSAYNIVVLYI